jgi:hypothetical protein
MQIWGGGNVVPPGLRQAAARWCNGIHVVVRVWCVHGFSLEFTRGGPEFAVSMCDVGRSPVFTHARDIELAPSGLKQRGPPRGA